MGIIPTFPWGSQISTNKTLCDPTLFQDRDQICVSKERGVSCLYIYWVRLVSVHPGECEVKWGRLYTLLYTVNQLPERRIKKIFAAPGESAPHRMSLPVRAPGDGQEADERYLLRHVARSGRLEHGPHEAQGNVRSTGRVRMRSPSARRGRCGEGGLGGTGAPRCGWRDALQRAARPEATFSVHTEGRWAKATFRMSRKRWNPCAAR